MFPWNFGNGLSGIDAWIGVAYSPAKEITEG